MDLVKKIIDLLLAGKSEDEVLAQVVADDSTLSAEEVAKAFETAKKTLEVKKTAENMNKKAIEEKKFQDAVKSEVETALKSIKVEGKAVPGTTVKENENSWKEDVKNFFVALTRKDYETLGKLSQKAENVYAEKFGTKAPSTGQIGATDADGGYLIRPEFDAEVDKKIYTASALMQAMTFRAGGYKTQINGMGTIAFTDRATELTEYTQAKTTISNTALKYVTAGALVPVQNSLLTDSYYDLVGELATLFADAEIRYFEDIVCVGRVTTTAQPFNGMWFTSGIGTDVVGTNSIHLTPTAGSGVIANVDLLKLLASIAGEFLAGASFMMPVKPLFALMNEQTTAGAFKMQVIKDGEKYIHVATGKQIIPVSDAVVSTLNTATPSKTTGSEAFIMAGDVSRFRLYRRGGLRVQTSQDYFFGSDCLAVRANVEYSQGIPTNSLKAFARLTGVQNIAG